MPEKVTITIVAYKNYDETKDAIRTLKQYTGSNFARILWLVHSHEFSFRTL